MQFARMCNKKRKKELPEGNSLYIDVLIFAVEKTQSAILLIISQKIRQFHVSKTLGKIFLAIQSDTGCQNRLSEPVIHKHKVLAVITVKTGREACGCESILLIIPLFVIQTARWSRNFRYRYLR